jgi:hypothetical protein
MKMLHRNMFTKHRSRTPDRDGYRAAIQSSREDAGRRSDLAGRRRRDRVTVLALDRHFHAQNPVMILAQGLRRSISDWTGAKVLAATMGSFTTRPWPRAAGLIAGRRLQSAPEDRAGVINVTDAWKTLLKFYICPEADASDQVRGAARMAVLRVRDSFDEANRLPRVGE